MDNAGFDNNNLSPANGMPHRSGSYVKRKISEDYNANQFPVNEAEDGDGRKVSAWSRRDSFGDEEELPELAPEEPGSKKWAEMTGAEKAKTVLNGLLKFVGLLACLYFFICALDLLGSGFKLLGGKATGEIFQESELLQNPVCGLMIGVMATVMVQSSSTSTSIVVAMTASRIINLELAIPIIMGANVGTSVTNTLVSLAQVGDREQFKRAFAGATVHDMFNWLSVIILLPLEVATSYLARLTGALVKGYGTGNSTSGKVELLTVLTDPLTELIIQIDKKVIEQTASANKSANHTGESGRILKIWCKDKSKKPGFFYVDDALDLDDDSSFFNTTGVPTAALTDAPALTTLPVSTALPGPTAPPGMVKCHHLFANWPNMPDSVAGAIILVASLSVLIASLIFLVKILNGVFKGSVGKILQKFLNAEFPGIFSFLTGYAAMGVGAVVTILVQSSSVFTSTLTPLVGLGAVTIERFYPLTLGSNIGTTFTAMMAAFAARGDDAQIALQIALCHLFFNLSGILLFFPIPFMRKMPIRLAKGLGRVTSEYRWFCAVYVIAMFIVAPAFILGLSMAGNIVFGVIFGILFLCLLVVVVINLMQKKKPEYLPALLQDWEFCPLPLHSLEPYDRVIVACATKCCGCCECVHNLRRDTVLMEGQQEGGGVDNPGLVVGFDARQKSVSMSRY